MPKLPQASMVMLRFRGLNPPYETEAVLDDRYKSHETVAPSHQVQVLELQIGPDVEQEDVL